MSLCESPYPELKGVRPLSHHLVLWARGVGHLELEQVIASWSIAILVKHNRCAGTTCTGQEKGIEQKKLNEKENHMQRSEEAVFLLTAHKML